ncbi:MAG: DUF1501 domain-containing protein [Planctomycetes bacterium]|nr:DUF1501 domain-containing protein [Planctomycetota bacterium]
MLDILGPAARYCDGISRRSFLKIGAFSFGAASLSLTDIYKAEANEGRSSSHKAVINIFLGGGPPHQDMWDIKTEAPREIRGEFYPIATSVPGIQIGECFPRLARIMDKCVAIRSVVGAPDRHDAVMCTTGWPHSSLQNIGGRPSVGAVLSRLQGPVDPSVPAFVGLAASTQHRPWGDPGQTGFLGPSYAPFKPDGPGMANMRLNGISSDRLSDRRGLLTSFDALRREIDATGAIEGLDSAQRRALDVLTSSKLVEALDISREPLRVRERYGDGKPYNFQFDGAPTVNEHLLVARRLVEAGVRCVTLTFGRWDSHGQNFQLVRDHGGKLDQCLSALIEDLELRGMLNDVTVIAWGEFGRTPRINNGAGRDHWSPVSCAFMAGGGMRTGQAIGATNRLGEHAFSRPVTHGEIFATIYRNLGLDPATTYIVDPSGRPQHLADRPVMRELVG